MNGAGHDARANRPPLGSPSPSRFFWVASEVPGETAMSRGLSLGGLEHTKSVSPRRHGRYVAPARNRIVPVFPVNPGLRNDRKLHN